TDFAEKELARLVEETHGIWNEKAERYLLAQFGVDIGEAA
ncbi:hypothetical protein LTSERUB_4882, partial [Salmonella enterica subsp. enterica serovar Rubislaw str. A4-653]